MNDPILEEIYEIRRRLWKEAGGTLEGLCVHCERAAEEYRAWDAQLVRGDMECGRPRRSTPIRRKTSARSRRGTKVTP